eukprot:2233291-Rhodomonas_salina.2
MPQKHRRRRQSGFGCAQNERGEVTSGSLVLLSELSDLLVGCGQLGLPPAPLGLSAANRGWVDERMRGWEDERMRG